MITLKGNVSVIENTEKEDIVQAVVVADNFNDNFAPVISKSPLALFPLVGVPLINYTLESLAQSGVHETFLFCCANVDTIKAHLQKSIEEKASWSVSMVLHIVVSESCRSFGDALRDLDAKGHIRGFFILTGVDTISNVQLIPLMEKHKEICKKDKEAVMTLIYKAAAPGHRAQSAGETVLLAANAKTNRVLLHKKLSPSGNLQKTSFPLEIFLEHSDIDIHSDLIDPHIAICSPDVLPLFADNFDFQTRDDFVKGILMNEEILGNTIYWHKLKGDQYAARVTNWQMYQTVSQDIIHRWAFPLVPDMGISKQHQTYMLLRNYVYRNRDVTLAKGCELEEDVLIAKGCKVDESTFVTRSVIGENVRIGRNCKIIDSFIMADTVVGENCHIEFSFLGLGCKIMLGAKINGCILGPRVQIDKITLEKGQLVQRTPSGESSQKLEEFAYTLSERQNTWDTESVDSDDSAHDANESGQIGFSDRWWDQKSDRYSVSSDDKSSHVMSPIPEDSNLFLQEVIDSLARGYEDKLNCDYLILEINSSRYAYNMALQEVNFYVVRALFNLPPMKAAANILSTLKDLINYFMPIVKNYIKGDDAMMDCLRAVEESCTQDVVSENRIGQVIHFLYDKDIVNEESVLSWYESIVEEKSALCQQKSLLKLIQWLQQASEESDEESDRS